MDALWQTNTTYTAKERIWNVPSFYFNPLVSSEVDFLSVWMHGAILWTMRTITLKEIFFFLCVSDVNFDFWPTDALGSNSDEKGVLCLGATKSPPNSVWKCNSMWPCNVSCVEHEWSPETAGFVLVGCGVCVLTMEHLRCFQDCPIKRLHAVWIWENKCSHIQIQLNHNLENMLARTKINALSGQEWLALK